MICIYPRHLPVSYTHLIVTFRDLEQATIAAIKCFGDDNTKNIILENNYKEYMEGFTDISTGEARRGYVDVVNELNTRFPNVDKIVTESDKKEFTKLFSEYLRIENILQNFDEFTNLRACLLYTSFRKLV